MNKSFYLFLQKRMHFETVLSNSYTSKSKTFLILSILIFRTNLTYLKQYFFINFIILLVFKLNLFFSTINTLISDGYNAGYKYPRIGLTDRGKVGTWRFMNGDSYNPHDKTQTAAFYWGNKQPNDPGEAHCASVFAGSPNSLNDISCNDNKLAICEIKYYVC